MRRKNCTSSGEAGNVNIQSGSLFDYENFSLHLFEANVYSFSIVMNIAVPKPKNRLNYTKAHSLQVLLVVSTWRCCVRTIRTLNWCFACSQHWYYGNLIISLQLLQEALFENRIFPVGIIQNCNFLLFSKKICEKWRGDWWSYNAHIVRIRHSSVLLKKNLHSE